MRSTLTLTRENRPAVARELRGLARRQQPVSSWNDDQVVPVMTAVLGSSTDGIVVLRAIRGPAGAVVDFELVMVSAAAERLLGQSATDLIGTRLSLTLRHTPRERFANYVNALETGTVWTSRIQLPGLADRWFDVTATGFSGEGLVTSFRDVTAEQSRDTRDEVINGLHRRQEILEQQALSDSLTGLGNRTLVASRLEHAVSRLDRTTTSVAVMFIDLDGLKTINDTHGHAAGDAVLVEIGERLRSVTRAYDTVARIGGDEFVVVCEDLDNHYDIDQIARRFIERCSAPVIFGDQELSVAASVGIAVADATNNCATEVLRQADAAMYRAKSKGGARVEYFDRHIHDQILTQRDIESGLEQAIAHGLLSIDFGTVVGADREPVAFRSHVGWAHPEHGFIDERTLACAANGTGIATVLTDWALDQALANIGPWLTSSSCVTGDFVMVDIDGDVLTNPGFADRLIGSLGRHQVDPAALCITVDGEYLTAHTDTVKVVLDQLASLGVRVAREGVMTTASSHSYLRELPISIVILDAALTDDLVESDTELLRAVIETAKGGGRQVMAPSATGMQFDRLAELGVDFILHSSRLGRQPAPLVATAA